MSSSYHYPTQKFGIYLTSRNDCLDVQLLLRASIRVLLGQFSRTILTRTLRTRLAEAGRGTSERL